MRINARVIQVEGISKVPGIAQTFDDELEAMEARRERSELLLLNVATGLAIMLVSCAWIAIALD
jgi:hypothetical protein